jgi:glyoxylase-like metal-dependent hydrolase (beta-lactamase superfamily II)
MGTHIDSVRVGVTNTYVLHDRGTVLIDPAGPLRYAGVPRQVTNLLERRPRLNLIIVTHGHFDHVGASAALHEATGAPIAIHRADADWLREGKVVWPKGVTTWGKVFRTIGPYGVDGRIVHTPGHSPGSLSVVLPSGEAFVGDLAMNGPPMCLHPSFGVFAHQPELVPASWRRLLGMGVRTVYPAHGRPFPASALPA